MVGCVQYFLCLLYLTFKKLNYNTIHCCLFVFEYHRGKKICFSKKKKYSTKKFPSIFFIFSKILFLTMVSIQIEITINSLRRYSIAKFYRQTNL